MLELRGLIDLDPGYLSRVVSRLERRGLIAQAPLRAGRARPAALADRRGGRAPTHSATRARPRRSAGCSSRSRWRARTSWSRRWRRSTSILAPAAEPRVELRAPAAGDLGWIVERHGALYAAEYGWGAGFEALVAEVIADHATARRRARNAAWIATLDGRRAGSILCVDAGGGTAKLRLLLVEPFARGHGIGARLVDECIRFARESGFRELVLWTNDVLAHARPIYERAGFELVDSAPHRMFGPEVVGQNWRMEL